MYRKNTSPEIKVTDKHILFCRGFLSNFYPATFTAQDHLFYNSEQYFHWQKAVLFGDEEIAKKILVTNSPKQARDLGRQVQDYLPDVWAKHRNKCMAKAIEAKFMQNYKLQEQLLSPEYRGRTFVECAPWDKIWGIGLSIDDPDADRELAWKGSNFLGKQLTNLRDSLLQ